MSAIWNTEELKSYEQMIRDGRGDVVRRELSQRDIKAIPESLVSGFAEVARRAGAPHLALKILTPLTGKASRVESLSSAVRLAYGAALIDVGVYQWGASVLQTVASDEFPQALLFRAHAQFNQWKSESALPLLEQFVLASQLTPYERAIGHLNLAAALIGVDRMDDAEGVLSELTNVARQNEWKLAFGSSLELKGQIYVLSGRHHEAERILIESNDALKSTYALPALWARKWLAINALLAGTQSTDKLEDVRLEAIEKRDFETVRECDLFRAKANQDIDLATKVFFGTSYAGYRRRMRRHLGEALFKNIPSQYTYYPESTGNRDDVIDRLTGQFSSRNQDDGGLEFGSLTHHLLFFLSSDLYRPFRIGNLFVNLFPNERFDPYTSPARVHQILNRLKVWIKKQKLGLEIKAKGSLFWMTGDTPIHYARPIDTDGFVDLQYEHLNSVFGADKFTAKEVADTFQIGLRTAQRLLRSYSERNLIHDFGAGKNREFWLNLTKLP